jgi:hypothetical protein
MDKEIDFVPALTDNDLMPFGKYKGKALINIPAPYLIYIYENNMVSHGGVRKYIIANEDVLRKQAKQAKR